MAAQSLQTQTPDTTDRLPGKVAPLAFTGDSYETPPHSISWFGRTFPTLQYLWTTLGVVRHDGALAVKGQYGNREWCEGSLYTIRGLERCGVHFSITGMENISKPDGPCVFIGNHMSTLETFALPCMIQPRKDVTYVVKRSLFNVPFFGHVLRTREPIVVDRVNPRQDFTAVMEGGLERLAKGRSVIVFPQSTRSDTFDPAQFNSMGVKLAKKAGVPIVPVALYTKAWGVGKYLKDFGPVNPALPVHFCFGEPLVVTGNGKDEHQQIVDFVGSHVLEWAREAAALTGA